MWHKLGNHPHEMCFWSLSFYSLSSDFNKTQVYLPYVWSVHSIVSLNLCSQAASLYYDVSNLIYTWAGSLALKDLNCGGEMTDKKKSSWKSIERLRFCSNEHLWPSSALQWTPPELRLVFFSGNLQMVTYYSSGQKWRIFQVISSFFATIQCCRFPCSTNWRWLKWMSLICAEQRFSNGSTESEEGRVNAQLCPLIPTWPSTGFFNAFLFIARTNVSVEF